MFKGKQKFRKQKKNKKKTNIREKRTHIIVYKKKTLPEHNKIN